MLISSEASLLGLQMAVTSFCPPVVIPLVCTYPKLFLQRHQFCWIRAHTYDLILEMVTHSNILAWRIPWTEEPGGLQSIGSQSQTLLKLLSISLKAPASHAVTSRGMGGWWGLGSEFQGNE